MTSCGFAMGHMSAVLLVASSCCASSCCASSCGAQFQCLPAAQKLVVEIYMVTPSALVLRQEQKV